MATSTMKYNGDTIWKSGDTAISEPIKYRLRNGICFINAYYSGQATISNTPVLITTLPSEYRPTTTLYFSVTNRGSSAQGYGYIDTDGNLYLCNSLGTMSYFLFDFSYPIK